MGNRQRLILACLVTWICVMFGCQRDGFECASTDDCFTGETCQSGSCVASKCEPETDTELCATSSQCGESEAFTDSCGELREVVCACANNDSDVCVPEDASELCAQANARCGGLEVSDSCGDSRTVNCGECESPESCQANQCIPCAPPVCPSEGIACGTASNACGDEIVCGNACADDQACIENVCSDPILAPPALSSGDRFGEEIRVDGELIVVGAPGTSVGGVEHAGAIYLFRLDGDSIQYLYRIEAADPDEDDGLGRVFDVLDGRLIAVAGTRLLKFELDSDTPRVEGNPLEFERPVKDITLRTPDEFLVGLDTRVDASPTLYVGTCDANGCELGDPWTPQTPEIGELGLGFAMDSADGVSFVGAPFDAVAGQNQSEPAGSYYWLGDTLDGMPNSTGWNGGPSQFRSGDFFDFSGREVPIRAGRSLSLAPNGLAVVGAPETTPGSLLQEAGVIFVFIPSLDERWKVGRRLISPADSSYARCGHSVAIAANSAFVSCMYDGGRDDSLETSQEIHTRGMVMRYRNEGIDWEIERNPIAARSAQFYDHFGWTLEGTPTALYVGAPGRNDDQGEVWIVPVE